ncbi:group III truncated hemoglobin [Marinilongibacter aquaticus]|uniref:group III truncated hemoglobin n=1 Tax=Marinilongibacter aquaticus TaxID=2975157 RepID=UPI0021BD3A1E|nr:group III truncated hemoglobin [Marinilongibacter aquaticus]UBM60318.1 group III truncated hemoglobin [Marinilongibacter aquaticus]
MKDIESREDIIALVTRFYTYVHADEFMAPVFQMPKEQFDRHLIRTYNFWDNWLFQTGEYKGGLMWAHIERNETHRITTKHFEHWLAHWFRATDELYSGKNADFVKSKALELGQFINQRLNGH